MNPIKETAVFRKQDLNTAVSLKKLIGYTNQRYN